MSAPAIRGWCPGALRPMESGDGWIVRVRPPGGQLAPDQAAGIAEAARRYGNGGIDLSSRANLQIRGVTPQTHPTLIEDLAALGLIDQSVEAEMRRNLVITPFWRPGDGTLELAAQVEAALAGGPALPAKFGCAIDCGPAPVLGDMPADIRLERAADGRLMVRADGAATGRPVDAAQAPALVRAMAQWFHDSGGVTQGRGRMLAHLGRVPLPDALHGALAPTRSVLRPMPGIIMHGALVALEFGSIQATTLLALARTGAVLRLTPWRMLLIEDAKTLPAIDALITDPADPRLRVTACTGAPGCSQGVGETRQLARMLAPRLPQAMHLHVSGCTKGCAHPAPVALTLVVTPGGFDLIRAGRAGDTPALTDLSAGDIRDYLAAIEGTA